MITLKNCPCCGYSAIASEFPDDYFTIACVECSNCELKMEILGEYNKGVNTLELVIDSWNKRV